MGKRNSSRTAKIATAQTKLRRSKRGKKEGDSPCQTPLAKAELSEELLGQVFHLLAYEDRIRAES